MTGIRFVNIRRATARSIALLVAVGVGVQAPEVAHAATSYTISDNATCSSFLTGIGASGLASSGTCYIFSGTLPAGDTLTITAGVLRPQGSPGFINNGTVAVTASAILYVAGGFVNNGTLTINNTGSVSYSDWTNHGVVNVPAGAQMVLNSNLTTDGTINVSGTMVIRGQVNNSGTFHNDGSTYVSGLFQNPCGSFVNTGTFTGNAIGDQCGPLVSIVQAAGQADPASSGPLLFTVTFDEDVTGFDDSDVSLAASTGDAPTSFSISGGPAVYTISVVVPVGAGTVVAQITGSATDGAENASRLASSVDNSVSFAVDAQPPTDPETPPDTDGDLGHFGGGDQFLLPAALVLIAGVALSAFGRRRPRHA